MNADQAKAEMILNDFTNGLQQLTRTGCGQRKGARWK
jgi:hypothetical protein